MTLACWITSIRFLLAPLIYWNLAANQGSGVAWGLGLLLLAGATDVLDGWAARARDEVSELGKTLDPLADKLVVLITLLALVARWDLPVWLVAIYLIKEVIQVLAGVFLLRKYQKLISANYWGKGATVGFFIGFVLFFVHRPTGMAFIFLAVLVSIYAFYTYYLEFQRIK